MMSLLATVLAASICFAIAERGYIFTAPTRFIPGRQEKLCVDLIDAGSDVDIRFTLKSVSGNLGQFGFRNGVQNDTLGSLIPRLFFRSGRDVSKCVSVVIPEDTDANYISIFMNGQSRRPGSSRRSSRRRSRSRSHFVSWRFEEEALVQTHRASVPKTITFIQTDKALYQPGQLVQFRIVTLDSRLRPLKKEIDLVYIESPSRTRVEQWSNTKVTTGLAQFELKLSEEPEQGEWKIVQSSNGQQYSQTFTVEEYVLPKFEVTVKAAKALTFLDRDAEFQVCAEYTFGQSVKGTILSTSCLTGRPCVHIREELHEGCNTIIVSKFNAGWNTYSSFRFGVKLSFKVGVQEKGTDVIVNGTDVEVPFSRNSVNLKLIGGTNFKPGLAYKGKVVATKLDGAPASGQAVEIRVNNWRYGTGTYVGRYNADRDGIVYFTLPPTASELTTAIIQANTIRGVNTRLVQEASARLVIKGWYSPTGSFLQIEPVKQKLKCGVDTTFTIHYTISSAISSLVIWKLVGTTDIASVHSKTVLLRTETQVQDRDRRDTWDNSNYDYNWHRAINNQKYHQVFATHKGSFTVQVPIHASTSPEGSLVVYYVGANGEVIADNMALDVEQCTENDVTMTFSENQVRPGESVDLSFTASPNSLCGYGVVDKSVFVLGGNNQLTLGNALDKVRRFSLPEWGGYSTIGLRHCFFQANVSEAVGCRDRCPRFSRFDNFDDFSRERDGFIGIDGADRKKRQTAKRRVTGWNVPYESSLTGFEEGGLVVKSSFEYRTGLCVEPCPTLFCPRPIRPIGPEGPRGVDGNNGPDGAVGPSGPDGGRSIRILPATTAPKPLPNVVVIEEDTVRSFFPESWLWDLVVTNDRGKAVVKSETPHTITEWTGNAVCLNDQDGLGISSAASITAFQPFFVSMILPYSVVQSEEVPIAVSVFNYLSECLTVRLTMGEAENYRIVSGEGQKIVCICSRDTVVEEFSLVMEKIGDVNISVSVVSVADQGLCPRGSKMSSQIGLRDGIIRSMIVEPEGAPREYTVGDYVCLDSGPVIEDFELPLPSAEDLVFGSERGYVKVIGDVLGPALMNLDNLLKMPSGCGEQNMVKFAPDVYVLDYLTVLGKDSDEIYYRAIGFLKSGYQRQLTYAHADQSYSAFGPRSGNVGSIWLTAFIVKSFARATDFIYIDQNIQQNSIRFIESHQQQDGCFPQIGMVYSKSLQGGIGRQGKNSPALTAYILIALLEAGIDSGAQTIQNGFDRCLGSQTVSDVYTEAVVAYAYSWYNPSSTTTESKLTALLQKAVSENGLSHWQTQESPNQGSHWYNRPNSANVEATAYALLALLRVKSDNYLVTALPIVRWLSNQRNAHGGFGSTQDTVIGLQALAEYALLTSTDGLKAVVTVHEQHTGSQVASFRLNDQNSFVEYSSKLPNVTNVQLRATGEGCFLFQANVRFNIKDADKNNQAFNTNATTRSIFDFTCTAQILNICTRYTGEDDNSNMAVIQVNMQSGWRADQRSLMDLLDVERSDVKRYEIDANNAVQLYFDQLDKTTKCFSFEIFREINVRNPKPAVITTFDYYEQELRQETSYLIDC